MNVKTKSKKYLNLFSIAMLLLMLIFISIGCKETKKSPYPETRKDNVKETLHGVQILDPYRWLEDYKNPEVRQWIEKQNQYTLSLLESLPFLTQLKKRVTELMKIDEISVPIVRKDRYFYSKRLATQELPIIYMQKGLKGKAEVLIDPHSLSKDYTASVKIMDVSEDGTILAYSVQQGGEDEVSIRFFDVEKHKDLADVLPKARYFSISMKPDKSGLYYTQYGFLKGSRVYYHQMGTNFKNDKEIFGKGFGLGTFGYAYLSEDGHYLLVHIFHGTKKSEIYSRDITQQGPMVNIVKDIDAMFFGTIIDNRIFIKTNWKAPKGRVLAVDLNQLPQKPAEWQVIIPGSDTVFETFSFIQGMGGKLFINCLENAAPIIKIFETNGQHVRDIRFPVIGSLSNLNGQWKSSEAFFSYSSYTVPTRIYRYDVTRGTHDIWAQIETSVKREHIELKQVWYTSTDGTRVPMFLVHRKGIKLDGSHPTMLTGYGGFNVPYSPQFFSSSSIWIENGGIFASASLRGGGEFGEAWHQAGMLDKKQNVFNDFIAAAEWLIQNKYTNREKLAIAGASNGGLLVGAALTQRPELFKAAVCLSPLFDMIRYQKFLVGPFWVPEYGSSDDPEQFKYLYAYSPYHQVKPGTKYPAVLSITGEADTRVAPLHSLKMTALLQNITGADNPVLLFYDTKLGHSFAQPLSERIEEITYLLGFIFWQLDIHFSG